MADALHGLGTLAAALAIVALPACTSAPRETAPAGLHTDFTQQGAFISPAGGAGWSFQATARALGCDGALAPLGEAAPEIHGDRTVYARPGLDEWYVRGQHGIEQGFTLPAPPACRRAGGEGVVIALGRGLGAVVDAGGRGARLRDATGSEVLRYADLRVVDAAGRELPASIEARGEGLALRFDDRGAAYPVVVDPMMWQVQQKLVEPDAGNGPDDFGGAVAVSGDTAIVGADGYGHFGEGTAYAFVRSGTHWSLQQMLSASEPVYGAAFGVAVALQGDTAAIGSFGNGEVYVFTRTGTTWQQTQEITACAGPTGGFGQTVALDGDTLVVGAGGGACVYLFTGGTWTLQQALTVPSADPSFGSSVALNGDTALVGAPLAGSSGSVSVFVRASGVWTQQQDLTSSSPDGGDGFGNSVAVEGDTAVVISSKAASLFKRSGGLWTQLQQLFAVAPISSLFTAALSGGRMVAGGDSNMSPAEIEVFAPGGAGLALEQTLGVGDVLSGGPVSVAMDGATIVTGQLTGGTVAVVALLSGDGEPCTSPGACLSGFCVDGVCCGVPSCPPAGPCNAAEHCQPGTGTCSGTPLHDGMPCPSDACTPDAVCRAGTCVGNVKVCAPADDCHEFGACDPSNGQCSTPAKPDGTPCAGGKTCTGGLCGGSAAPNASGNGCACDAAGDVPAGGALISCLALTLLRRRRRRARARSVL